MAFPSNPSDGDIFSRFNRQYTYNATIGKWSAVKTTSATTLASIESNIVPADNTNVNIGSADNRITDIYLKSDSVINIGDRAITTSNFVNSTNFAKNGDLTVSTGTSRWYAPRNITVSKITARLGTAADSAIILEILKNNVLDQSINIAAGDLQSVSTSTIAMTESDYLQINVTAVGSSAKGSDLNIQFIYN